MEPRRQIDDDAGRRRPRLGVPLESAPRNDHSIIQRVERPRLIAWTGKTLGIEAIHVWHLEPQNGSTFVRTEEWFEGLVVRLFRRSIHKTLDRSLGD